MTAPVRVAVPRKGRPLEAVFERLAAVTDGDDLAHDVISTLRYEKAVAKGAIEPSRGVYERIAAYSDLEEPTAPEFTLLRDDRPGMPRRVVFDSVTVHVDGVVVQLVGREEPFRALRTHSFSLGFDSADLVLEEVVSLEPDGIGSLADVNARIDPRETDVRIVSGLGDTVYHTLMASPDVLTPGDDLNREFVAEYEGELCISPRYERLVEAVLGTDTLRNLTFAYPDGAREEEAAIADVGLGVYLTMTGSTAREHGLLLGEHLFPSETVLMENVREVDDRADRVRSLVSGDDLDSEIRV